MHPSELSLLDLFRAASRHRRLACGFLGIAGVATLLAVWLVPRNYRSESKLYVRLGRESASLDPASIVGRDLPTALMSTPHENEINSVAEILQSRVLLEQVVDIVGVDAILDGTAPESAPLEGQADGARRRQSEQPAWPTPISGRPIATKRSSSWKQ